MEMLENQHKKESNEAQMIIDDLNHKIEAMTVSIYGIYTSAASRDDKYFLSIFPEVDKVNILGISVDLSVYGRDLLFELTFLTFYVLHGT